MNKGYIRAWEAEISSQFWQPQDIEATSLVQEAKENNIRSWPS
jgi:hypothetical protein